MLDLGDVHPEATLGPLRTPDGSTVLGRMTTTEEQRQEVIARCTDAITAQSNRGREVRATVHWPRGEPTVMTVTFDTEHIEGKPVFLPDSVSETTLSGAAILPNEQARLRILQAELADIHEHGML